MNIKKTLLVSIFLLALFTLGSVSATDDMDFNETLTVDETQEAPIDASVDDETLEESELVLASSSEDVLSEGEITQDNFNRWVSNHEWVDANWGPDVVNVWGDDNVREGSVGVTISKEEVLFSDEKSFDGGDSVVWNLNELKDSGINEIGTYTISLKYSLDEREIALGEYNFSLTEYNFNTMEGEQYNEFPFGIIRIYDDVKAEINVNDRDESYVIVKENPIGWNLADLDITSTGNYTITIVFYDEDDVFVDEYTFYLELVDRLEWFRLHAPFDIQSRDLDNPVLYLYTPDNEFGEGYALNVTNDNIGFENVINFEIGSNWMNWTLEDFGIEKNEGYHVELLKNGEYITDAWLNVQGIIDVDSFNSWVSSHESVNSEGNSWIVNVHAHGYLSEGDVVVTIVNPESIGKTYTKTFEEDADEHNDVIWTLDDLSDFLNQAGTYTFNVTYIKGGTPVDLITDFDFTLTENDYNVYEGDVYVDYPFDIIRIWDDLLEVEVYVGDSTTPIQSGGTDPLRWTLADLGIDGPGDYAITINASKDGVKEGFTFHLNVYDDSEDLIFYSNSLGVRNWEIEDDVLYLVSRDEDNGKPLRILINGNDDYAIEFEITDSVMSWNLTALGITENGGYDITLFDGEDEIAGTYLDVWGFEEKIRVNIWNEEEQGKLYNDYTGDVISVDVPEEESYGEIVIIVNGENEYTWTVDWEDRYHEWSLCDLEMTDEGEYNIEVKRVVYDEDVIESEDLLAEATLNVYTFDNDNFRAILDKDSEILKVYCYDEGTIFITVEREGDEEPETVNEIEITIENTGEWIEFSLKDLGFAHDGAYYSFDVVIKNSDEEEMYHFNGGHSVEPVSPDVADGDIYLDWESNIINVYVPNGNSGKLEVIVNGNVMYISNAYPDREYFWNLKTLNITETGDYAITVKFNGETIAESNINVKEFENDTFRVKCYYVEGVGYDIFCPEDAEGTITVYVYDREQDDKLVETHEIPIDDKYKGKWTSLEFETEYDLDENAFIEVEIDGNVLDMEEIYYVDYGVGFEVNHVETGCSFNDGEVVIAYIPYDRTLGNASINITSGEYSFYIKLNELDGYEWDGGAYKFALTKDDLNYFNDLSDKDVIKFVFVHEKGKLTRWMSLKKEDDDFSVYGLTSSEGEFGTICAYGLEIIMEANTFTEDDEYEEESETVKSDYFATVSIPDSFNVGNGKINIVSGENIIFSKNLSQINHNYLYSVAGNRYYISFDDLNLENINDKDMVNITLTSSGEVIEFLTLIHRIIDGNSVFFEYFGKLEFSVHYGGLANPEFGMGEQDSSFINALIPDAMGITGGNIIITREDGTVLFNWSLDSFDNTDSRFIKEYSQFYQGFEYTIMANETIYSALPENENLTFTFVCGDKTISHKGIVKDGSLYRIVVSDDVTQNMFEIIIPDNVLVNGNEFAVTIRNINANRQSINFDLGGGYFSVYVNGKRIEDLGRLNRYDGERELELTRLCSNTDGVNELTIYLGDLDITENGVYDIRVTHCTEDDGTLQQESEIFSRNVTLTSNVKAENASSKAYTGFGMDPIIVYLDTYYGDITSDVTGNITVLNSTGDEILFIPDIKALEHDEKGYYLKYSNFENKNFGDKILVKYEGNERSGNTTVNVTWKDVNATDFTPIINDDVNDYYGEIVNIQIPDLINAGEIIVTVKFKNNPVTSISDMNVTTDYDTQAVYKFKIPDIKANGNQLAFSLSDLGFYIENGDYDLDVKYSFDGSELLDLSNATSEVNLSKAIDININMESRYTKTLPFASVRIYEPTTSDKVELYIDGTLYKGNEYFKKGMVNFTSSDKWAPGVHTAEIRVLNEFGTVLASLTREFEVLVKSNDVTLTYDENVNENANAVITLNVPVEGNVTILVDGVEKLIKELTSGSNSIDLGVLSHGNHNIGIFYEATLENGNVTFYNGNINVNVDFASWIDMPYPVVLNEDDTIKFNLGEDATGYIIVKIDDETYPNINLENGKAEFKIPALGFGKHSFTLSYSEDPSITQSGEFEVTYLFRDDIIVEGYPLMDLYKFTVSLPANASGTVTVYVDTNDDSSHGDDILGANADSNNAYVSPVKDGKAVFNIPNLSFGEHKIIIKYSGDDYYPEGRIETVLNVSYYAVIGDFENGNRTLSLLLPENATGNLTVYNNNRKEIVATVAVSNGRATLDLTKLPVGIYEINAYYDGDDYDVRAFSTSFKVMPKVNISQDEKIGEDIEIYVDMDNTTGHLLIVIDGVSPVLEDLVNGSVNYTFKTKDYSYGNHSVTFMYIGNAIDPDIFNIQDETGRYVPIKYPMNILPIHNQGKVESVEGNTMKIVFTDENGEQATDLNGDLEIYVNGELKEVVKIVNGVAEVDTSKYPDGETDFSWLFRGNNKFASSTGSAKVNIKNPVAKITAKDITVVYSAGTKYAVTVYNAQGGLAANAAVSFLINNKLFKTVKTNAKGVASVAITSNPGNYKITTKALGATATKKLKVNHVLSLKKVKVKRSAKKLVIKATLKKVNGKYLKGKKITLKFNGKKFKAKTNKKGVAKFTIKKNILKKLKKGKKVKYQATYLKDTVKYTVKVK